MHDTLLCTTHPALVSNAKRCNVHVVPITCMTPRGVHTSSGAVLEQVDVDTAFFSERDCLALRYDLTDCGIYICAPDVLVLFSDNFDFQHIQRDFIRGVLSEEELGNKLFVHELPSSEYGAVCANLRAYAAISKDIMQRWMYPFCPDSNLLPPATEADVATGYFVSRRCMCAPAAL